MKRLVLATIVWTAFAVIFLVVVGGDINTPGCMRVIGPSLECVAGMVAANEHEWWTRTLPTMAFVASGYIAIGVRAARTWHRTRRAAP